MKKKIGFLLRAGPITIIIVLISLMTIASNAQIIIPESNTKVDNSAITATQPENINIDVKVNSEVTIINTDLVGNNNIVTESTMSAAIRPSANNDFNSNYSNSTSDKGPAEAISDENVINSMIVEKDNNVVSDGTNIHNKGMSTNNFVNTDATKEHWILVANVSSSTTDQRYWVSVTTSATMAHSYVINMISKQKINASTLSSTVSKTAKGNIEGIQVLKHPDLVVETTTSILTESNDTENPTYEIGAMGPIAVLKCPILVVMSVDNMNMDRTSAVKKMTKKRKKSHRFTNERTVMKYPVIISNNNWTSIPTNNPSQSVA